MASCASQFRCVRAVAEEVISMMLDTPPTISVVICAYTEKRWDDLLAAVRSIQQQSFPAHEIILVIDHNPALFEQVKTQIPGVIHRENTEPQGLSGARNSGVAAARGEFIAFLDDDAIADSHWLEFLARCFQDQQVLGAGGVTIPFWTGTAPAWFPREFYWVIGCNYQDFQDKVTRVRNPFGGNICIRREVFEEVGGFRTGLGRTDEKPLPLGGEETELCIRARGRWPDRFFVCDPAAISEHHIPPQRMNRRYFRSRCYAEGLSKATIILYTGSRNGLAEERAYTMRTLPLGFLRGLRDGICGDLVGFARAWMILVGLFMTAAGYTIGRLSQLTLARDQRRSYVGELGSLVSEKRGKEVSFK